MDKLSDVFSDLFSNDSIDENNLNAIWVDIDKGIEANWLMAHANNLFNHGFVCLIRTAVG
jgi:hypothetical protein